MSHTQVALRRVAGGAPASSEFEDTWGKLRLLALQKRVRIPAPAERGSIGADLAMISEVHFTRCRINCAVTLNEPGWSVGDH
jgi:hypothetical protein